MPDMKTPLILTYTQSINPATALPVDTHLFTVPAGAEFEVVEVAEIHTVAGSDGSAVTLDVVKLSDGTAPGSGTSVLSTTFNLKSTANTKVTMSKAKGTLASQAARTLSSGQTLALNYSGTLTASAGVAVTVSLRMLRPPSDR